MDRFTDLPVPDGTRFGPVRLVAETGSTNADLLVDGAKGIAEGSVLVTDHQTQGRGRQRRVWHDEPGSSLLVSVLLRPRRVLAPLVPLVAGLAAADAATATAPVDPTVGLKWPNDVLAPSHDERKLAGILSEASSTGARADDLVVVVGTGINLRWPVLPPQEVAARAVTLEELAGHPVDRDQVLSHYLLALDHWLTILEEDGPLLDAYRTACLTIGREVRFATADGEITGVAADVSSAGTLLLDTDDGRRVELHAGDAHHI